MFTRHTKKKGSTNVGHLLKIGIDSQQLLE